MASYWICWQVAHSVFAAEDRINRAMAGHTAIEKYIYNNIFFEVTISQEILLK